MKTRHIVWLGIFIIAVVVLWLYVGCGDDRKTPVELSYESLAMQTSFEGLNLQEEFQKQLRTGKIAAISKPSIGCIPDPLPAVGWRIGEPQAVVGDTVRVPVWVDTGGLPTWGGLLFISFDAHKLNAVGSGSVANIVPGPMWDTDPEMGFTHWGSFHPWDGKINMLILGWHICYIDGVRRACPLEPEELEDPFFYFEFLAEKAGKAKVYWDPLPKDFKTWEFPFYRRSEVLTLTECGDWDTLNYWKSEPNSTGSTYVINGTVRLSRGRIGG